MARDVDHHVTDGHHLVVGRRGARLPQERQIEDHQVGRVVAHGRRRLLAVGGLGHPVTTGPQGGGHGPAHHRVVVDHQDVRHVGSARPRDP